MEPNAIITSTTNSLLQWREQNTNGIALVRYTSEELRDQCIADLMDSGFGAVVHFAPPSADQAADHMATHLSRTLAEDPRQGVQVLFPRQINNSEAEVVAALGTLRAQREAYAPGPMMEVWWLAESIARLEHDVTPDPLAGLTLELQLGDPSPRLRDMTRAVFPVVDWTRDATYSLTGPSLRSEPVGDPYAMGLEFLDLARQLREMGNAELVVIACRAAAAMLDLATAHNRLAAEPHLEETVDIYADALGALNQHELAYEAGDYRIQVLRSLMGRDRATYLPVLAGALKTQAYTALEMDDDPAVTLRLFREAALLYRELIAIDRYRWLKGYTSVVNGTGNTLASMDDHRAAATAYTEAIELCRELEARFPGEHLYEIGGTLSNLSLSQEALGDLPAALASVEQSVQFFRQAAQRNREDSQPALAGALLELGRQREENHDLLGALAVAEEAEMLFRDLMNSEADQHQSRFAECLFLVANTRFALELYEGALASAREAEELFRVLLKVDPVNSLLPLIQSVMLVAKGLLKKQDYAAAVPKCQEALVFFGMLMSKRQTAREYAGQFDEAMANYLFACEKAGVAPDQVLLAQFGKATAPKTAGGLLGALGKKLFGR
jgi:tetratricopeptide (TPR) repeat protein